jgi:hypothetical protein
MITNRFSDLSQSLCDPVLWDAEAIHAEYVYVKSHLGYCAKIGYIGVHCLP